MGCLGGNIRSESLKAVLWEKTAGGAEDNRKEESLT